MRCIDKGPSSCRVAAGEWRDNLQHGVGRQVFADGAVFKGTWEQGLWVQGPACAATTGLTDSQEGALDGPLRLEAAAGVPLAVMVQVSVAAHLTLDT